MGISVARLEHVKRGIETWAVDLAEALREQKIDVVLFKGSGECRHPYERVLSSIKVGSRWSKAICRILPRCLWRIGLGSDEQLEETTFGISLARAMRRERIDILHMQDAHVANVIRRLQPFFFPNLKVILGHGTEERPEFLRRFECLQQLAPYHLQELLSVEPRSSLRPLVATADRMDTPPVPDCAGGRAGNLHERGDATEGGDGCVNRRGMLPSPISETACHGEEYIRENLCYPWFEDSSRRWCAIPNFVDTDRFKPAAGTEMRRRLGIPAMAKVILSVAAIKKHHKRIDYLIEEVARLENDDVWLVVAGAATSDTPGLLEMARERLGERVVFVTDLPHEEMHTIYNVGDIYTLTSLKDMMPIALLEALASGLPCIVSEYPVQTWMVGQGGESVDMSRPGSLAEAIERNLADPELMSRRAAAARERAVAMFSKDVVIGQYIDYYRRVLSTPPAPEVS